MVIQPGDKGKIAVLLPLIILAIVFVAFRLSASTAKAPQNAPPPIAVATHDVAAAAPVVSAPVAAGPPTDPFWRPFVVDEVAKSNPLLYASQHAEKQTKGGPGSAGVHGLPALGPGGPGGPLAIRPMLQDLELQGIMADDRGFAVAVLREGDTVRYLSPGAAIDTSTRLKSISTGAAFITQDGATIRLILGQKLVRGGGAAASKTTVLQNPQDNRGDSIPAAFAP